MKRGKRGISSHVEVIISFVLFVSFVLFLLVFIRPYETDVLSDSILLNLKNSVEEAVTINFTKVLVNSEGGGCDPNVSSEPILIIQEEKQGYFYALYSSEFSSVNTSGCTNHRLGNIVREKVVSNQSLYDLRDSYYSDYDSLKEELNFPENVDFGIMVDGIEMKREVPEDLSVLSRSFASKVLYSNGDLEAKNIVYMIW